MAAGSGKTTFGSVIFPFISGPWGRAGTAENKPQNIIKENTLLNETMYNHCNHPHTNHESGKHKTAGSVDQAAGISMT